MVMNISCKFDKASYIFFIRAVTSLYTLRRRCNKAKCIVSTGRYPVDTNSLDILSKDKICLLGFLQHCTKVNILDQKIRGIICRANFLYCGKCKHFLLCTNHLYK